MKANAGKRKIFDAVDLLTEDTSAQITEVKAENGVELIVIDSIKVFHNHPFHLYEGERLDDMVESIREHGVLNPVIVLKSADGYEMLSGHNRANAARLAGLTKIPAIVKVGLSEAEAYVYVIASEYGFSSRNAARYLRLNHLIQPFKNLMDENKIALLAAVDVSYLTEDEQKMLWNIVERQGLKVKPAYAEKLRKASGNLTEEKMAEILEALQVKHTDGNAGVSFKLPKSICSKYFDGMDSKQMAAVVEQALAAWFEGKEAAVV